MKKMNYHCAKVVLLAVAMAFSVAVQAQTRNFSWGNIQRQYLLFEPSDRTGALPVMYFLHGLGDNITRCANEMHFDNLAERYGWVIVVPQATNVSGATMWNAGLGGTADDAGFLLALLDSLVADGKVNADSVFFTGFSMGGFMTHRMAIEHGDRITACAPVSGLITFAFADYVPPVPVRMMHIHGTADNVVGWFGLFRYHRHQCGLGGQFLDRMEQLRVCAYFRYTARQGKRRTSFHTFHLQWRGRVPVAQSGRWYT